MVTERELFAGALERPDPAERRAYLADACGADSERLRRLEQLLAAHAAVDEFMVCPPELVCEGGPSAEAPTVSIECDSSVSTPGSALRKQTRDRALPEGTLFGRYRMERLLGRGGMASVYLATDLRLNRRVAIKIPRFDAESSPELIERFEREARIMASVEHRNLCGIHDVGELDGVHYLSMEYVEGETLAHVLERGEHFSPRRIAQLLQQLARGTRRAHQAGVVHRDLKPANVMIDGEGEPVIMDFGLAHARHDDARLTGAGYVLGTPAYMAPEQALGDRDQIGTWTDIYSLGAILYELLTGQPVYTGSTTRVLGQLVADKPIASPRSLRPGVDPRLEAICLRSLARRPEDRFLTADQLLEALDEYLRGAANPALDSGPTGSGQAMGSGSAAGGAGLLPAVLPARRYKTPWGPAAFLGLGLIGLAAVFVGPIRRGTLFRTTEEPAQATLTPGQAAASTASDPPHPLLSPDYVWSDPVNLGPGVNSASDEENASVSADGRILVFNRRVDGRQTLWESRRASPNEPFGQAVMLDAELNRPGFEQETPYLSLDGLTLWFASNRPTSIGPRDLWVAQRPALDAPWEPPVNLGPKVNTPGFEHTPYVTANGLTLLFSRALRQGMFEICLASRSSSAAPFEMRQVLANVNGGDTSSFPRWTEDERVMVFVFSPRGSGKLLLMAAARASPRDDFPTPVELPPIGDHHTIFGISLSADGRTLYFSAKDPRQPSSGGDLWSVTRVARP